MSTKRYINTAFDSNSSQFVTSFSSFFTKIMLFKLFNIFVTLLLVQAVWSATSGKENVETFQEVTYYDPKTGISLNIDADDLRRSNSIVAMIYQRSLCNREDNAYGCCLGIHVKSFKTSVCVKLIKNQNVADIEVTANKKVLYKHAAQVNVPEICGKLFPGVKLCERSQVSVVKDHIQVCPNIRLKEELTFKNDMKLPCFNISKKGISIASNHS